MKNHFCADPLCLARVAEKGELCDECKEAIEGSDNDDYEQNINEGAN